MQTETKKRHGLPGAAIGALGVLGALLVLYVGFAAWLRIDGRFPFRTTLNGRDISLQRALDVQRTCMDGYYPNMRFEVDGRGAAPYSVTPLSFDFSEAERVVSFLPHNMLTWPASLFRDTEYTTSDGSALDKLAQHIEADCALVYGSRSVAAENAYLAYDAESNRFRIVPDTDGTVIDGEKFAAALKRHILYGSGDLDLEAAGVYYNAEIRSDSVELVTLCNRLNRFAAAEIVFTEGGMTKVFPARKLLPYVYVSPGSFEPIYDAAAAASDGLFDLFAAELAAELDSKGGAHDFITHDGAIVSVDERTWRSKLDAAGTSAALAALSFADIAAEGGPPAGRLVWEKAALDALTNYVEIDLTNQQLILYTGGETVLESPIVSGCTAQGHGTPGGAFKLDGKYRNVTLRGPDYASFVRYWMPFNRAIGMHDASWRSRFGGTIYRYNGSHGCINLPHDAAETIFNTIDDSYAVVCYWRPAA